MQKDMQIHIEKGRKIIDDYLPTEYVDKVLAKLPKEPAISKAIIRNVRSGVTNRLDILDAMVEVALEYKQLRENFIKKIA